MKSNRMFAILIAMSFISFGSSLNAGLFDFFKSYEAQLKSVEEKLKGNLTPEAKKKYEMKKAYLTKKIANMKKAKKEAEKAAKKAKKSIKKAKKAY